MKRLVFDRLSCLVHAQLEFLSIVEFAYANFDIVATFSHRSRQKSYYIYVNSSSPLITTPLYQHFVCSDAFCRSRQNILFVDNDSCKFLYSFKCKLGYVQPPPNLLCRNRNAVKLKAANSWGMTGVTCEWYQGLRHQQQWRKIVAWLLLQSIRDCCDCRQFVRFSWWSSA